MVFGGYRYPPKTWTAWIPLQIDGEAKDARLWQRMVTEDFLTVAVQTAWLVAGRLVHKHGIGRAMAQHVVPQLASRPPLATGLPPDPATAALDSERLASFYLCVLAQDPRLLPDMLAITPTAAWRARPALISPAF